MLERIMDLQILLYLMTVLGTAGAIGMLAVTPYLQKNPAKDKSDNKPERKMAESVEDTR